MGEREAGGACRPPHVCCTVGAVVGLSSAPLMFLLPIEYVRIVGRAAGGVVVVGTIWLVLDWLLERGERRR